ncbi:MAG: hypothetical protein ACHQM6_09120, partial [Candidatus Kapaibacterium sp.]
MDKTTAIRSMIAGLLLAVLTLPVFGQKQNNIWYFDDSLGIDFTSGKPVLLLDGVMWNSGGIDTPGDGDGSISDRNTGKLLFYTCGHRRVFNRLHHLMPSPYDSSLGETVVIVPMGCDTSKYVIANIVDGWSNDLHSYGVYPPLVDYAVVDMEQDGGNGAVVNPPFELLRGSTDRLTALPHANGTDSWIISHSLFDKYYRSWHVSSRGVNPTPVFSYSDSGDYPNFGGWPIDDEGMYNTSPDGTKIVDISIQGSMHLLDFDPQTGHVTLNHVIKGVDPITACFSPDNSKLYFSMLEVGSEGIYQYDIQTRKIVRIDSSQASASWGLQLGPDRKIYISKERASWLGVISDPNAVGSACNYQPFGFYLGGRKTARVYAYLPTNMNSYPGAVSGNCEKITADFSTIAGCNGKCISFSDWSNGSPTSWKWSFPGGKASSDTG